jgi:hypothetical protein
MSKNIMMLLMLVALGSMLAINGNSVYAEKCEDISGVEKWDGEGHGDSDPSKSEFKEMLNDESVTICEMAESIDHMEVTGSVKDWSDFEDTTVFMSTTEEVQDCLKDRYELPDDDGDEHLADYEIQKCATGEY